MAWSTTVGASKNIGTGDFNEAGALEVFAYCTNVTMLCAGKLYVNCPPFTATAVC